MTSEGGNEANPGVESETPEPASTTARRELMPLPGVAVIALYMLVLAGVAIVGVVHGYIRPPYLMLSAAFISAGMGLLLLFRWAWTLTLAAVVLLMGLFVWRFTGGHDVSSLMQGGLNLVIFLYLIRPEVRAHLR